MKVEYVAIKAYARGFSKQGEPRLKAVVQNMADNFRDCLAWGGRKRGGKPVVIRKRRRPYRLADFVEA